MAKRKPEPEDEAMIVLEGNPMVGEIIPIIRKTREKALTDFIEQSDWLTPEDLSDIEKVSIGGDLLWFLKQTIHTKFLAGSLTITDIKEAAEVWKSLLRDLREVEENGVRVDDSGEEVVSGEIGRQRKAIAGYRKGS